MITIVLAEDQTMLRSALVSLLAMEKDIEVLAAVADGNEAWQAVQQQRPDVLVTDIEMPGMSGIEVAARWRPACAAICSRTRLPNSWPPLRSEERRVGQEITRMRAVRGESIGT